MKPITERGFIEYMLSWSSEIEVLAGQKISSSEFDTI